MGQKEEGVIFGKDMSVKWPYFVNEENSEPRARRGGGGGGRGKELGGGKQRRAETVTS